MIASYEQFGDALAAAGLTGITSQVIEAPEFFYAEDYHQQYLAKRGLENCH